MSNNLLTKIFFLAALFTSVHISGQDYLQKAYNINDGLVQSFVSALHQDDNGYIWIGTENGLSRFDGSKFTNYIEPAEVFDDVIKNIFQDKDGNILLLKPDGKLWKFNGITFELYPLPGELNNPFITDAKQFGDSLFIASRNTGLFIITPDTTKNITTQDGLLSNEIVKMSFDRKGNLFLYSNNGINRISNNEIFTQLNKKNNNTWCVLEHSNGSYWEAQNQFGLIHYKNGRRSVYPLYAGIECYELTEDSLGVVWLASSVGLQKIIENSFGEIYIFHDIVAMSVSGLLIDKEGNIWSGTRGRGLNKTTKNLFSNLCHDEGFPSFFGRILLKDSKENIWVSAIQAGLLRYDGRFNYYFTQDGLPGNHVSAVTEDNEGNIIIAVNDEIALFKDGKFHDFDPGSILPQGRKYFVYFDSRNRLWASVAYIGLYYRENNSWHNFDLLPDSTATHISVIFEDKNANLWIGTKQQGLHLYDGETATIIEGHGTEYTYTIVEDGQGKVWVGSDKGISIYDNYKPAGKFTNENGLPSNKVYALTAHNEKMLVGTSDGFGIYDQNKFKFFNTADGIGSNDISSKIFAVDEWGKIWMGTTAGISLFNIKAFLRESKTYNVVLNSIETEQESFALDKLNAPEESIIEFKTGTDLIKFNFTTIDFDDNPIEYRFKYSNDDNFGNWINSESNTIILTDISYGNYKMLLSVRAFGDDWQNVKEISFLIPPSFYQTRAFIFSIIGIFILGGLSLFFYKKNNSIKYKTSSLSKERSIEISVMLKKLMEEEKLFTDATITLQTISDKLGVTKENISQVVNSSFKQNFNDFVNSYRIAEAKKLLLQKPDEHIIQIAYESGFNTKASFNNSFKKIVGQTPSQFRKSSEK